MGLQSLFFKTVETQGGVSEYLPLCHLQPHHAHRGFWVGLNGESWMVMPRENSCWTLVEYINCALWVKGSSFTVCEVDEDPTASVQPHLPSITTPEPDPAPTPTVEVEQEPTAGQETLQMPPLYGSVGLLHPLGFTGVLAHTGTPPRSPGPSMPLGLSVHLSSPWLVPISSAVRHPSPGLWALIGCLLIHGFFHHPLHLVSLTDISACFQIFFSSSSTFRAPSFPPQSNC